MKDLNKPEPIQLSSRELSTRFMVDTCLAIFSTAGAVMGHWARSNPTAGIFGMPAEPEPDKPLSETEKESQFACAKTLWAAAERIKKILDDDDRWSLDFQKRTEQHFEEVARRQKEVLEIQRMAAIKQQEAAAEITSPHFRYKPMLCRMVDGSWLAVLGSLDDLENSIQGVGPTPQVALDAFDAAFVGITHPATLEWLAQREKNLETGAKDKPWPGLNNTNEVDERTNQDTNDSPSGGIQSCGDSSQDGSGDSSGEQQNPPTEPPSGWDR